MKTKLNFDYKVDYWEVKIYHWDDDAHDCYLFDSLSAKDYDEAYLLMRAHSRKAEYITLTAIPKDNSVPHREFWEYGKFVRELSGKC